MCRGLCPALAAARLPKDTRYSPVCRAISGGAGVSSGPQRWPSHLREQSLLDGAAENAIPQPQMLRTWPRVSDLHEQMAGSVLSAFATSGGNASPHRTISRTGRHVYSLEITTAWRL